MMQAAKKIPFEDDNVLLGIRILYISSNVLIAGIYLYIQNKINTKKGTPPVASFPLPGQPRCNPPKYSPTYNVTNPHPDRTTLKYVQPPPMGSQEDPKLVTTTIHAYDSEQLRQAFKGQLIGVAMMAFMHLYLQYKQPLIIQSILPFKGALETNLAKIYIFGSPASGDLKRPWKSGGGGLAALMGGGGSEVKTDKASIEAAEKAGRGGAKEE